jgi:hypothetical protein
MNNDPFILDNDINENGPLKTVNTVSLGKFIFLFIATMGMYGFWWSYKTWRFFKERSNSDINPIARALFAIFFHYDLITRVQYFAEEKEYDKNYSPGLLTFGFIASNFLSYLSFPLNFLSMTSFVFLIPPFQAWNYALEQADDVKVVYQNGITGRHVLAVALGILFWILTIAGLSAEGQL